MSITITETPKFRHSYPYQCTFLGTFKTGGDFRDLYHSKTFDGITLISRYGDESLEFYGESLKIAIYDKDEIESSIGECWRRAKEMGLELVDKKKY